MKGKSASSGPLGGPLLRHHTPRGGRGVHSVVPAASEPTHAALRLLPPHPSWALKRVSARDALPDSDGEKQHNRRKNSKRLCHNSWTTGAARTKRGQKESRAHPYPREPSAKYAGCMVRYKGTVPGRYNTTPQPSTPEQSLARATRLPSAPHGKRYVRAHRGTPQGLQLARGAASYAVGAHT